MKTLTIGKVARAAGVGVETVRFYEQRGLIEKPPRLASGYRQYPQDTVRRLRFIKRAKELGFTLKEIYELLSMRMRSDTRCADIRAEAETKLIDIGRKIRDLEGMRNALRYLADTCTSESSLDECPILKALDYGEK